MKNKLLISLLLTIFITCFNVMQANAVSVGLNVLDSYIEIGETFDVEVWLYGEGIGENLVAFGFDVNTPGTYFTYTGYTIGSDFDFDDSDFGNPYNVAGSFPNILQDDYLLATLSFSADTAGIDSLSLAGLYDGMFYGLFYELSGFDIDTSTSITVNTPVPEPGTMFLLGSGLAGMVFYRKRLGTATS